MAVTRGPRTPVKENASIRAITAYFLGHMDANSSMTRQDLMWDMAEAGMPYSAEIFNRWRRFQEAQGNLTTALETVPAKHQGGRTVARYTWVGPERRKDVPMDTHRLAVQMLAAPSRPIVLDTPHGLIPFTESELTDQEMYLR